MKKISTVLLVLSIFLKVSIGQTPATITFTTSNAVGSSISFYMAAITSTIVQVDFGDGTKINEAISGTITKINGTLVGSQTVKIYGTPIVSFEIDDVPLTSLDVSNNAALTKLWCLHDQLAALDVSKNTALTLLSCYANKLSALDITKNTALTILDCEDNLLTTLDITKNITLTQIGCGYNKLTALDVSKNTALTALTCLNNQLTFTSLPLKQTAWTPYTYAPQTPISITSTLGTGTNLDISNQLTINGNSTVYTWKTKGGTTLVAGTDYTINDGKTVFLKAQTDSVYCEMTNTTFPDLTDNYVLKTTNTKVTGSSGIEDIKTEVPEIHSHNKTLYINLTYCAQCSVFDINGRLITSRPVYIGANSMQVQSGIYLVKVTGNMNIVTKKIVVQ